MSRRIILTTLIAATVLASASLASAATPSADERLRDLRKRLAAVERSLADAKDDASMISSQRDIAFEGREQALAEAEAARQDARAWRYTSYALFAVFVAAGAVSMVRRRNTIRIQIPDTPEELLEASEPPGSGER